MGVTRADLWYGASCRDLAEANVTVDQLQQQQLQLESMTQTNMVNSVQMLRAAEARRIMLSELSSAWRNPQRATNVNSMFITAAKLGGLVFSHLVQVSVRLYVGCAVAVVCGLCRRRCVRACFSLLVLWCLLTHRRHGQILVRLGQGQALGAPS